MITTISTAVSRAFRHPRSVMNATTARALIAHLATTLVLGVVVLLAAWQFMFDGATH